MVTGLTKKILFVLCSAALIAMLVQADQKPKNFSSNKKIPIPVVNDEDEHQVYSALLQALYNKGGKILVIEKNVSGCTSVGKNIEGEKAWQQSLNGLSKKMPKLDPGTLQDFKSKLRQCRQVSSNLTSSTKFLLIESSERKNIFAVRDTTKAWENFYRKYPNSSGYISVSNIGFNPDRTQALIDSFQKCGVKCGSEKMVLMTKVNGEWVITSTSKVWEL